MFRRVRIRAVAVLALCTAVLLTSAVTAQDAQARGATTAAYVETATDNPVVAAPPVTRPDTSSCSVTLASRFPSNATDGTPQDYHGTLAPPKACPGPWSAVILDQTISVSDRQYDRSASLQIGRTTVYFGTTQEPSGPTPTVYHVGTDITRFSSLLRTDPPYRGGIGNYTDSVYTGVYLQTVMITYYRTGPNAPAARVPDAVVGSPILNATPASHIVHVQLSGLPRNITRAVLEITLKGNGCDEQWFDAVTDPVSAKFPKAGLCGNGPYREADVGLDNQPVGAVQTFPYIYSGGIVPTLWRPVPAIGTFDLTPESLDMTPFVGQLVNGKSHDLLINLDNANDTWNIIPTLLLYTDHHAARTSGKLVTDDVNPVASELQLAQDDGTSITSTVTSSRKDTTSGYVTTSAGRITTTVVRSSSYRNVDTVEDAGLTQHVTQAASGVQTVTSTAGRTHVVASHTWNYPLQVDSAVPVFTDDQNFSLSGRVSMSRILSDSVAGGLGPHSRSTDTLTSTGSLSRTDGVTTASDGSSSAQYSGVDTHGSVYRSRVTSAHGRITAYSATRYGARRLR